jgi:formate dehydrogenase iron-sulfur subunit
MRSRAAARVEILRQSGVTSARLYGEDPGDGVGGFGSLFLLLDRPEVYGLPPRPLDPTRRSGTMWASAAAAALALAAGVFAGYGRRR